MIQIPEEILALIRDAEEARRTYQRERGDARDTFIASDPADAMRALLDLDDRSGRFLEWGSGLGTVTMIAATLGFEAHGIEANERLVETARELAERHGIEASFGAGTFIPEGFEANPSRGEENLYHDIPADDGYEEIGLSLEDFDLVYVYPWAQEVGFFQRLFSSGAHDGARLLINLGDDGFTMLRR